MTKRTPWIEQAHAWVEFHVMQELSMGNAKPSELADNIGGIPVVISGRGWLGFMVLSHQAVLGRLRSLRRRGYVNRRHDGSWSLVFPRGYNALAVLSKLPDERRYVA